ncbi:MAG: hypothetical protein DRI37_03170 [Chloroflexi bacterium]|nr:MAG: hypothetical protein DRI37_03170 [Chloroflexota bacterium]
MKFLKFITFIFVLFVVAGCAGKDDVLIISPLQSPQVTATPPMICSPINESVGAIEGVLYLMDDCPSSGSVLYLGEYIGLDTENPVVIMDPARHISITTDEKGYFCFDNVTPNTYGLIVWNAVESVLVNSSENQYSLMIKAEAGETFDTGKIYTPIP